MAYKAIIAGATGLVGNYLLQVLLFGDEYDEVVVVTRRKLPLVHDKLEQLVIDFDHLHDVSAEITGHAVFSCLGTIRSKSPDPQQYRKIDHQYPLQLAHIAKQNGVEQFHVISAVGANTNSMFAYTKLKGELEADLKKVQLPALHIYQPSLLVGDRKEQQRPMESFLFGLIKVVDPILIGSLKKYRSINASTVANAMFRKSLSGESGTFTYTTDKIKEI